MIGNPLVAELERLRAENVKEQAAYRSACDTLGYYSRRIAELEEHVAVLVAALHYRSAN